jgi:hypothetical protein
MENNEERWRELCARAALEQDPKKLMELVQEISRLLAEKEKRNKAHREDPGENDPKLPAKS